MQIFAILDCLGNTDKSKVYACSVQRHFFPWLADFTDAEPMATEGVAE